MKDREEELRRGFLDGTAAPASNRYSVVVKTQRRQVFQHARLPEHVRNDPYYWEERVTRAVVVQDRRAPAGARAEDGAVLEGEA
jgi:hypothetical protein